MRNRYSNEWRLNMAAENEKHVTLVETVDARFVAPTPPRLGLPELVVSATGSVPTTGWSKAHLVKRVATRKDVLEFDFLATPPSGPAGDIVSGIVGGAVVPDPPRNIRAVRVYAANNDKEGAIAEATTAKR
jgi:hypothetical protein